MRRNSGMVKKVKQDAHRWVRANKQMAHKAEGHRLSQLQVEKEYDFDDVILLLPSDLKKVHIVRLIGPLHKLQDFFGFDEFIPVFVQGNVVVGDMIFDSQTFRVVNVCCEDGNDPVLAQRAMKEAVMALKSMTVLV